MGKLSNTLSQLEVNDLYLFEYFSFISCVAFDTFLRYPETSLHYSRDLHQCSKHIITSTMLSIFNPFRSVAPRPPDVIPLDPVKTHEVETTRSDSARTLKHLLKLNHAKHAILYSHDRFHNHLPHVRPSLLIHPVSGDLVS